VLHGACALWGSNARSFLLAKNRNRHIGVVRGLLT
jgi:hypothetical protein